ncbi:alpha-amylase family glycosyl hydrolase, partial [Staphylococcus aureus]|uniref:alpha-amylase family glycosyl hydrolase n=1 Tax=Staphylococcus aureus TaxID=1280 RepID=UPI00210C1ED9
VNHWIDFGVDGFRFDVINLISKGEFKDSDKIGKEFCTDGAHLLQTLIALVVGTLVSALNYGLIKPKLTETEIEASKSMDE